jgi:glycosyltransferase involved in cell wall biosynthesis
LRSQIAALRWAILTGEYPPQPGGVSDYCRLLAQGLAEAGDEVHVWFQSAAGPAPAESKDECTPAATGGNANMFVHRLPRGFGPRALRLLNAELRRLPRPYRLLVQYVPQAFGWKGMNVLFCLWLYTRRQPMSWVMFHEVAFPLRWAQPLKHNLLGMVTRFMASLVVRRADRVFVSIPAWEPYLRQLGLFRRPVTWLPVPSNVSTAVSAQAIAEIRTRYGLTPGTLFLGHFGTYAADTAALLGSVLSSLLSTDVRRVMLLIGRGSERYQDWLERYHPNLRGRVHASGSLPGEEIAAHLASCDVLLQPYVDGVSSRRGSLMAGLALGLAIVTNQGRLTESLWQTSQAVRLVPAFSAPLLVAATESLLANPASRVELGRRAAELYRERFTLARMIQTLRGG